MPDGDTIRLIEEIDANWKSRAYDALTFVLPQALESIEKNKIPIPTPRKVLLITWLIQCITTLNLDELQVIRDIVGLWIQTSTSEDILRREIETG